MWIPGVSDRPRVRYLDPAYIDVREAGAVQVRANMKIHTGLPPTIRSKVITPLIGVRRDSLRRGLQPEPLGGFRGLVGGKG